MVVGSGGKRSHTIETMYPSPPSSMATASGSTVRALSPATLLLWYASSLRSSR